MLAKLILILMLLALFLLSSCNIEKKQLWNVEKVSQAENSKENLSVAYFAGGCFWCTEAAFEKVEGVVFVISGFSGGIEINPSYKEVARGETSHIETIKVYYDPTKVSYQKLVHTLLLQIDPTDSGGSFVDRGPQYTSAIFYSNKEEKQIAEQALKDISTLYHLNGKKLAVALREFENFYEAEEYHQDYYSKNPIRYKYYRGNSGRDQYLNSVWTKENLALLNGFLESNPTVDANNFVKPSDEELKEKLTDIQYKITQKDGTERAFTGKYDKFYEKGIYVDLVSGEVLFSSIEKYDSGSGWPSFIAPVNKENVVLLEDKKLFTTRTEVRSKLADSHLGHVFDDGPYDKGGKRYCINSAALRFVAFEDMEKEGYGDYLYLFD